MIDTPLPTFSMGSAMIGYRISLQFNTEETKPGCHEYTFVAVIHSGRFGEGKPEFISHAASPDLAVHNVIDLRFLTLKSDLTPEEGEQLAAHRVRFNEAIKLYREEGAPSTEAVTHLDRFGGWVDAVTDNHQRSPERVALRALEELTETCLDLNCSAGMIYGAVTDALHNQSLKAAAQSGHTVFPSQLNNGRPVQDKDPLAELADTRLVLADLAHVLGANEAEIQKLMLDKWAKLSRAYATGELDHNHQTFYIRKAHIK
jgi:hypothetical protein